MKLFPLLLFVVATSGALAVEDGTAKRRAIDGMAGDWVGGFDDGNNWIYVLLHFKEDKATVGGTLDRPLEFVMGARLSRVVFQSPRLQFEVETPERLSFVGTARDGIITGKVMHQIRLCRLLIRFPCKIWWNPSRLPPLPIPPPL